jgi:hypothetical protein
MCAILELATLENIKAFENRWHAVRLNKTRAMLVYQLSQEEVDFLLSSPLEVLVEKIKDVKQAIFVDNQFTDLLKVAAIQAAPASAVPNVIALRG